MNYDEARAKRLRIESMYLAEMRNPANAKSNMLGKESARLIDLNKQLAHAIADEAHAYRDSGRASQS